MLDPRRHCELLTPAEMGEADRLTIAGGVPGIALMERAGAAVAEEAARMTKSAGRVAVQCGPGGNGGDGFVAARLLAARGYRVSLGLLGERAALRGDPALAAARWSGAVAPAEALDLSAADLVIDALFGAGLSRDLDGAALHCVEAINAVARAGKPVLSVDVPSGVDGATGAVRGAAVEASASVTFFRLKPGHLLLPGRLSSGRLVLAEIGSAPSSLDAIAPRCFVNAPAIWLSALPRPGLASHKYSRGVALVVSGPAHRTGAARLAARAALRVGAGLVTCGNLQRDEWVLIHGGAGGVGLAALQIALWRGARAIVTAGSPEKRDLARALGAEYAFDSRSGAFVDEVMRVTAGRGVSLVLNSLAGEAMERSLGLLEPFGRFVELGKRDYLANTPIGLRPFRRNLSYFGVDLDQLLVGRPDLSRQLFAQVLALFSSGDLTPLPYVVFAHADIVEAMRLMQQAGHVGKILVRPPPEGAALAPTGAGLSVDPDRTHLITGGLGGFGLATARWLIERGARHLVLVGRSGAKTESAQLAVAQLRASGANVRVEALDIADAEAASALFDDLAGAMPPLAGIVHAAMTLDDAIVANLDEARLIAVLRPKVAGAENLDRLSRGLSLDYFLLFSSATTVIGNPGQGAYVAANGFLEGLARRRREAGLPALAVGWGAIADVGVLARKSSIRDSLAARAGVKGIPARLALDLMSEASSRAGGPAGDAFVAIAAMNWTAARAHLPLLRSPSYSRLWSDDEVGESQRKEGVDLSQLAATLPPDQARRAVADIIVEEIARVLRLPKQDVSRSKPLSEIGLDSLMSVELALSVETRFELDAPVNASMSDLNVMDLAGQVLATAVQGDQDFAVAKRLARSHMAEEDRDYVAPLIDALREKGVDLTGAPVPQPS